MTKIFLNIFSNDKDITKYQGFSAVHDATPRTMPVLQYHDVVFLWHLSKTMPLCVQYGILKIMHRILCKTEGSKPC